jgi:hypothetical protein
MSQYTVAGPLVVIKSAQMALRGRGSQKKKEISNSFQLRFQTIKDKYFKRATK